MSKKLKGAVIEPVVETPEVETPKETKKKAKTSLGFLGGRPISAINERVINGKKYNDVILEDGTGYLLSDKDLAAQIK